MSTVPTRIRSIEVVSWLTAIIPWLAILGLVTAALYVRDSLGKWPVLYADTPFYSSAGASARTVFMVWWLSPILAGVVAVLRHQLEAPRSLGRWAATYALGWVLLFIALNLDPTGFVAWSFG